MQAVKYLELRIPAECMDETAFKQLAESLQTLGTAMETEVDIILDPGMAFGTARTLAKEKNLQIVSFHL